MARWRAENRERVLERGRALRERNRAAYNQKKKKWWEGNKEKARESCRKWHAANKVSVNARRKRDLEKNPSFKIRKTLTDRLRCALIRRGETKDSSVLVYLGCSIGHLRKHLEAQFLKGMNWRNYGWNGWHIDHIIPCAKFNLAKEDERQKCFHFSNLRPLWATQNHQKSCKIITCQPELPLSFA